MEYLNKLGNKLENFIEAMKMLKIENSDLKARLAKFEEKTVKNDKDNDEIQEKVLGMIEMIDKMKDTE